MTEKENSDMIIQIVLWDWGVQIAEGLFQTRSGNYKVFKEIYGRIKI